MPVANVPSREAQMMGRTLPRIHGEVGLEGADGRIQSSEQEPKVE